VGEQRALTIFYELLLHSSPGSLILIDEAEISLHVVWQDGARMADLEVVIATHSPDMIHVRRDLVVELKGSGSGSAVPGL